MTAKGPLNDDPIVGPIFRDDLQRQEADFEANIPDVLRYYPVLSLSISIGS